MLSNIAIAAVLILLLVVGLASFVTNRMLKWPD
jgi:hypothetical protein